jgi:ribosome recycling factor
MNTTTVATVRSFGKGSRMGNHITKLDDISHDKVKEEAKIGREKKKEKSKPARLAAKKEDTAPQHQQNVVTKQEIASDDDDDDDDNTNDALLLPTNDTVKSKMLLVITSLERSFSSIRGGGEVTPELFDSVRVLAYGELVPISSVGQVIIDDPRRVTISCFDPAIASMVRDAVRDMSTMNLSPYVEEGGSGVVIVPIPRVSDETRKEVTKELGRQAENTRQRIRSIRRKAMDIVKRGKEGKLDGISKDDAFRVEKDIESITKEVLLRLDDIVAKKQKSVMED